MKRDRQDQDVLHGSSSAGCVPGIYG
jgi:hypothetical protein